MTRNSNTWIPALIAVAALVVGGPSACGGDDGDDNGGGDPIEIAGSYDDEWGTTYTFADTLITMTGMGAPSEFNISSFDNADDFLLAQNGSANEFNPDLWSRFDWTWSGSDLYLCQVAYEAATEADALAATGADPADLTGAGCNGFAWSKLTPTE